MRWLRRSWQPRPHPTQIVEADRWLQQHADLKGDALAKAVDAQSWDPGVKALTQFPGLLGMMDKNLSWTSSLGEAYVNGQQNVLDAVQVMRQRAQQAGNLKSTPQESVTTQGNTIVIEPADPQVVYVPEYDPWVVYGDPLAFYPGWIGVPGFFFDGPGIEFGVGIGIGLFGGFGWGWHQLGNGLARTRLDSRRSPVRPPQQGVRQSQRLRSRTRRLRSFRWIRLVAAHSVMPAVAGAAMAARLPASIPARSAASITEATRGHFPLAEGQASAEVSMVAEVSTVAEASMVAEVTDENDARTTVKSIEGA